MNMRAYLLIDVVGSVDQKEFIAILSEIESIPGVEYVDPVDGEHDIIVIIDTAPTVETVVAALKAKPWLKKLEVCRIISAFERQVRFSKNRA